MKNLSILGTLVLLTLGVAIAGASPAAATNVEQVCAGLDSGKIDTVGDPPTVTITATLGYEITGYCIKAGSTKQGNGPVYVTVDPPKTSITVGHPSGKDVSHYSWSESKIVVVTTTQPPETTQPPVTTIPETTVATTVPPTTAPPTTDSSVPPSTEPPVVQPTTLPPPSSTPPSPSVVVPVGELPATGAGVWIMGIIAAFCVLAGIFVMAAAKVAGDSDDDLGYPRG